MRAFAFYSILETGESSITVVDAPNGNTVNQQAVSAIKEETSA